ncbi:CcdC family protein [Paenibacillus eucommiae]|uniref:Membrane protein CcdC involved in cytochrome C biogenesis n=1 Tax=Paenibacillus eucommiae TaxID=1355755 RepID=A0ABS4J060_9BACL|nr:cytochrome c biogenesis protein CcdC [Paenibacillus eucommiae]MBP1992710.1 membrane protein CcdC involved in cytochrome C biogenesis [Paenibacillus eucommiae]
MPTTSYLHMILLLGSLGAALGVTFIRLRAANKPVNVMKIIMPPLGMSTGFLMFLAPMMRIPVSWALCAFLVGSVVFAYPLIRTSRFHSINGHIYLRRSKAFVWILLLLLVVRLSLHEYIESYVTTFQTAAIFFILAFGMLLPWRISMYIQFRKLQAHTEIPIPKNG